MGRASRALQAGAWRRGCSDLDSGSSHSHFQYGIDKWTAALMSLVVQVDYGIDRFAKPRRRRGTCEVSPVSSLAASSFESPPEPPRSAPTESRDSHSRIHDND